MPEMQIELIAETNVRANSCSQCKGHIVTLRACVGLQQSQYLRVCIDSQLPGLCYSSK